MNPSPIIKNQDGIGILSVVLLMPIVLLLVAFFLHRWGELRDSKVQRQACREVLARGQKDAGYQIQALLDLNAVVRELKAEKIVAEAALLAASLVQNIPNMREAEAWLHRIDIRQQATRRLQTAVIQIGNAAMERALQKVQSDLRRLDVKVGSSERKVEEVRTQKKRLAVRKLDADDPNPEYELEPDFSARQALELNWHSHYRVRRNLSGKEDPIWNPRNARIPESCGMTLVAENRLGRGFAVAPSQDKYFWKR